MSEKKPKMLWFRFARFTFRILFKLFFKMRFYGVENFPDQEPFLLISNHQSFLDPIFCGISFTGRMYFLARHTLFKNKFFGWLINSVNTIPVKRGQADLSAMKAVINKLKTGNSVCLFPEATRTRDGMITPFKPGFGLLCRRSRTGIVPVVIDGAFECWSRHKKLPSMGAKIVVRYGKYISADEIKIINDKELAKKLTDTLRNMQNQCRIEQGKEPYDYSQ